MDMILNDIKINDLDALIANSDDTALDGYFRDGTLSEFLRDCFYTDEADAVDRIDRKLKGKALHDAIVEAISGKSTVQTISVGRSDLTPDPDPKAPTLTYKKWTDYLKKKSRAFREANGTVYTSKSAVLLKKLGLENERCYLVHDDSLFQNGAYGFAVLIDGIAYDQMMGSRKKRFLSYEEIRSHGGLVNDENIPAFKWYADWYKEEKGEKVWIPVPDRFMDAFVSYVNDLAEKNAKFGFAGKSEE